MEDETRLTVHGATAYPATAASARVRIVNHIPFLRKLDIELDHMPTLSADDYALLTSSANLARKATVLGRSALRALAIDDRSGMLLIHRLLLLMPLPGIDPPRRLDVYDFDDALTVGSAAATNRRFQWTKQEGRRAITCMRRARLVFAANSILASQARLHASRVEVLPSCVDPVAQPLHAHGVGETLTVGWIGSHTTAAYLKPLLPVVGRLHERGLRVRLTVIGADTGVRAPWIEHRPWSLASQAADLASFDIGVMPLPDDAWARGKSGYKLLQYFAAGVPAIASPVGINSELVAEGRGIAATSPAEWERALVEMGADADSRRQRGESARRYVEEHYSYQRWAPELASMLKALA